MNAVAEAGAGTALEAGADARVLRLEAAYNAIAAGSMLGMPVVNAALRVQAVGFAARERLAMFGEAMPDAASAAMALRAAAPDTGLLGVLITPWSMNLIWLPDDAARIAAPGTTRSHRLGDADYAFIGGGAAAAGAHEACSLFSPMFEFDGQAAAVAVAEEVLRMLAPAPAAPADSAANANAASHAEPAPHAARRAFLRGGRR